MFDYCSAAWRLPVEVKAEAAQPSTSGYHTQLQWLLKKKKKNRSLNSKFSRPDGQIALQRIRVFFFFFFFLKARIGML